MCVEQKSVKVTKCLAVKERHILQFVGEKHYKTQILDLFIIKANQNIVSTETICQIGRRENKKEIDFAIAMSNIFFSTCNFSSFTKYEAVLV